MADQPSSSQTERRLRDVLRDDLNEQDFWRRVGREFTDLKDAMLTEDQHSRLRSMWPLQRWATMGWWLLKGLFLKLTPTRRLLLVAGVIMLMVRLDYRTNGQSIGGNLDVVGLLLLLFVLMLELKDKLVAKHELEDGHAIQRALMPERVPEVPGWQLWLFTRAANEVGGDLVDCIRIRDQRFGVAIGDVAGKGLRAALLTAKLQATLRALGPDASSLPDLLGRTNSIFVRDSLPQMFASVVYAEISPDVSLVRLVNAGHIPPIVVRRGHVTQLEKGGPALGLMHQAAFPEERVTLDPGEFMVMYSDGLTEMRTSEGEFYGEGRLRTVLSECAPFTADVIGERLINEVDRFRGEARAHDDISIVILKRS